MQQRHPTVEELVSTLHRSKLPTVIVEGRDDMQIFRWMEEHLKVHEVDVLGVGGRPNLFAMTEKANFSISLLLLSLTKIKNCLPNFQLAMTK